MQAIWEPVTCPLRERPVWRANYRTIGGPASPDSHRRSASFRLLPRIGRVSPARRKIRVRPSLSATGGAVATLATSERLAS